MARSQDRRPGFSRRAQYGIFTGYVVAVLGVVAGIVLLVVSLINPGAFSFARAAAGEVGRPLGSAGAETRNAGQGVFDAVGAYFRAGRQNAALRREVEAARANAVTMKALEQENRRLKSLLGIVDEARLPVTTARLIGSTSTSTRRFAVLAAGARQGVQTGFPVRSASGLVGRVVEVGPTTARVLLVTDPENVVPVRRATDGLAAFVQGGARGSVQIRLINTGVSTVRKGDVFVTSGSGGLYPPNVPVAVAVTPTRDGAEGHLASDPANAEFVIVERAYQSEAQAVLNRVQDAAENAGSLEAP